MPNARPTTVSIARKLAPLAGWKTPLRINFKRFSNLLTFKAPEVIMNHDYSEQCDQWSIGVILYALLSRRFPFMADTEEGLYEAIKRAEVEFSGREWASISDSGWYF